MLYIISYFKSLSSYCTPFKVLLLHTPVFLEMLVLDLNFTFKYFMGKDIKMIILYQSLF